MYSLAYLIRTLGADPIDCEDLRLPVADTKATRSRLIVQ